MNTDDYDGHTPGPWRIEYEYGEGQDEMSGGRTYICGKNATIIWQCETTHADAELVAAAPDLLAEVKRKTEQADAVWDFIEQNAPHLLHDATTVWNTYEEWDDE